MQMLHSRLVADGTLDALAHHLQLCKLRARHGPAKLLTALDGLTVQFTEVPARRIRSVRKAWMSISWMATSAGYRQLPEANS